MTTRRVLMIAYHFPPLAGSSGIQRTLRFVQHLPSMGWQPLVLTVRSQAYERTSHDLQSDVPTGTVVRRAFAFDTARHLSIGGRYIGAMARPDRWVSWRFDAVRQGMAMIQRHEVDLVWTTYPIATAHLIGAELQRRSGLPWVADFRDPMAQEGYPADPLTWNHYKRIEQHAVLKAEATTFTTPGAARIYSQRYPAAAGRIHVVENGYDEESFAAVEASGTPGAPLNPGALTVLHSGIVYPQERDPTQLIVALRLMLDRGTLRPDAFRIRFRAAVQDDLLRRLAAEHGVSDFVEMLPPIPYKDALREMLCADALLVMQAGDCNEQIPAKLYEYLRAGRPVLCLSDPAGDTVGVARAAGLAGIARIDDAADIAGLLQRFIDGDTATRTLADPRFVAAASRAGRAAELAALMSALVGTIATRR